MHRQPLLEALARYRDRFPDEAPVADRIASLVSAHADCFDRVCRPGHVTGSAWVLSADRTRCLVLHHRKLDRWLQPGGHADGDPDVVAVARREAMEESGLPRLALLDDVLVGDIDGKGDSDEPTPFDLDVHIIPARHDADGRLIDDEHEHHDVRFLFAAVGDDPLVLSDESHAVRWATPDELRRLTDEESVLRMLRKAAPHMA